MTDPSDTDAAAPPASPHPAPGTDTDHQQLQPHEHRHAHAESTRLPFWLTIVFAVAFGALVTLQSRVNGELARAIGD